MKTKTPKKYDHPLLESMLRDNMACQDERLKAMRHARKHRTLVQAVKTSPPSMNLDWFISKSEVKVTDRDEDLMGFKDVALCNDSLCSICEPMRNLVKKAGSQKKLKTQIRQTELKYAIKAAARLDKAEARLRAKQKARAS